MAKPDETTAVQELKSNNDTGSSDAYAQSPVLPEIRLQGIRFHAVTEKQAIQFILDELDAGRGGWLITHNLDHLRRLSRDPSFDELCAGATLVVADGMPLVWASRLQHTPVPERVAGSNLTVSLSSAAASRGRSVFLLGGVPGTAKGICWSSSPSSSRRGISTEPLAPQASPVRPMITAQLRTK